MINMVRPLGKSEFIKISQKVFEMRIEGTKSTSTFNLMGNTVVL